MTRKPLKAVLNHAGGYDLLTERDAGNPILCLTGTPGRSKDFWQRLILLAEDALREMEWPDSPPQKELTR